MLPDPPPSESSKNESVSSEGAAPQASEADLVRPPLKTEQATQHTENRGLPPGPDTQESWFSKHLFGIVYSCLVLAVCLSLGWIGQRIAKAVASFAATQSRRGTQAVATSHSVDSVLQVHAEALLRRLASGDPAAADLILLQSDNWIGKTRRTQNTDQFVTTATNSRDMHAREAALQAQLALDGIRRDKTGFRALQQAVGNPRLRPWALWSLGALGNRGVDPVHAAKIIESYLTDPDLSVRAGAVDGLSLLATDETVPMLLDRFRNDPSPLVQEHAACDMSQSGMYTRAQRMHAGATLVGWLDDALLTSQQRLWTVQALHDITGASPGPDSAAWHTWWAQNSHR